MLPPAQGWGRNDELMERAGSFNRLTMSEPNTTTRLARAKFRAWHRGTREADYMIGGFFDAYHATWSEDELAWFERLLDEEDVDIMAWALGTAEAPADFHGDQFTALRKLDYVRI